MITWQDVILAALSVAWLVCMARIIYVWGCEVDRATGRRP